VPGIVHLIQVHEHELVIALLQPGQGSVHYLPVGDSIFACCVKAGTDRGLGDQFLEPVIAGNGGL